MSSRQKKEMQTCGMDNSEDIHFYKTRTLFDFESKQKECQIYLSHFIDEPPKAQIG